MKILNISVVLVLFLSVVYSVYAFTEIGYLKAENHNLEVESRYLATERQMFLEQRRFLISLVEENRSHYQLGSVVSLLRPSDNARESKEKGSVYLMAKYMTFRFSNEGALLSVVADK